MLQQLYCVKKYKFVPNICIILTTYHKYICNIQEACFSLRKFTLWLVPLAYILNLDICLYTSWKWLYIRTSHFMLLTNCHRLLYNNTMFTNWIEFTIYTVVRVQINNQIETYMLCNVWSDIACCHDNNLMMLFSNVNV